MCVNGWESEYPFSVNSYESEYPKTDESGNINESGKISSSVNLVSMVLRIYMHGTFHVLLIISSFKISLFKFYLLIKGLKINFASGKINLLLIVWN